VATLACINLQTAQALLAPWRQQLKGCSSVVIANVW